MKIAYERANGQYAVFEFEDAVFRDRLTGDLIPEVDMLAHAQDCETHGILLDVELVSYTAFREAA